MRDGSPRQPNVQRLDSTPTYRLGRLHRNIEVHMHSRQRSSPVGEFARRPPRWQQSALARGVPCNISLQSNGGSRGLGHGRCVATVWLGGTVPYLRVRQDSRVAVPGWDPPTIAAFQCVVDAILLHDGKLGGTHGAREPSLPLATCALGRHHFSYPKHLARGPRARLCLSCQAYLARHAS